MGDLDMERRKPGGAFDRLEAADAEEGSVFSLTTSSLSTLSSPVRTRGLVDVGGDGPSEVFPWAVTSFREAVDCEGS
jgi:hypothetical protein